MKVLLKLTVIAIVSAMVITPASSYAWSNLHTIYGEDTKTTAIPSSLYYTTLYLHIEAPSSGCGTSAVVDEGGDVQFGVTDCTGNCNETNGVINDNSETYSYRTHTYNSPSGTAKGLCTTDFKEDLPCTSGTPD